jgi:hypothetical protein
MTVTTGSNPKQTRPGLAGRFDGMVADMKPIWKDIFDIKQSRKAYEEVISLYNLGLAEELAEGDSVVYSDFSQGLTIRHTNKSYGLGVIITEDAIDDDLYESLTGRASKGLAQAHNSTGEFVHANILNNGFTIVGHHQEGGDGKVLFASDHINKSGTFSNLLSAAALSRATLEAAFIAIRLSKEETGVHFSGASPKTLVVPEQLRFDAQRILESPLQPENQYNAINPMYNSIRVISWPYLTSQTAYFIQTDVPEGLIHYDRKPLHLRETNTDDNFNVKILTKSRWVCGVLDVRGAYGSVGA